MSQISIDGVSGKIIIKGNGKTKEYKDIFSVIRAHIYSIVRLCDQGADPMLIQNTIQRTSFLISLKKNDIKELEKALIELKAVLTNEEDRVRLSIINRNIARLRNVKVIPVLKTIAEKYIPLFNKKDQEKLEGNLKQFIQELEEVRKKIQEEERKLKPTKPTEKTLSFKQISKEIFVAKVYNIFDEEIFITVALIGSNLKILNTFINEERLYDYRKLIPKEEEIEYLKKALFELKHQDIIEEESHLGRS